MNHINKPFFSVVIPIYNKSKHIERCINSVLAQSYQDFELILVDDASTDNSLLKVKEYTDQRIRILNRFKPGPGGYAARNFGVKKSRANWIAFLDADDEWLTSHLFHAYLEIIENNNLSLITSAWIISDDKKHTPNSYYLKKYKKGKHYFFATDFINNDRPMWTGAVFVKKNLFDKVGGFDENWAHGADVSFWLNLLLNNNGDALWLCRLTSIYHTDSVNMVTSKLTQTTSPVTELIRKHIEDNLYLSKYEKRRMVKFANRRALKCFLRKNIESNNLLHEMKKTFILDVDDFCFLLKIFLKQYLKR